MKLIEVANQYRECREAALGLDANHNPKKAQGASK